MDKGKFFLTDYGSYNNGTQFEFGHWVDLNEYDDVEELNDYIQEHFVNADKKSPLDNFGSKREEVMITDYEGFPEHFYSECMRFENLFEYFKRIEDSNFDFEVIEAFADYGNYSLDDLDEFFDALEESYSGQYDNDIDFAQDMHEQTGDSISDSWPHNCIDWDRAARDLMFDYFESNGYYFRNL